jgi:protein TonB
VRVLVSTAALFVITAAQTATAQAPHAPAAASVRVPVASQSVGVTPTASRGAAPARNVALHSVVPTDASGAFEQYQVDRPAAVVLEAPIMYPPTLRDRFRDGDVVARFVVDTTGRVEPQTVTIVRSSHPLFTAAVRAALPRSRYSPAELNGRRVRQVVLLPVRFARPR